MFISVSVFPAFASYIRSTIRLRPTAATPDDNRPQCRTEKMSPFERSSLTESSTPPHSNATHCAAIVELPSPVVAALTDSMCDNVRQTQKNDQVASLNARGATRFIHCVSFISISALILELLTYVEICSLSTQNRCNSSQDHNRRTHPFSFASTMPINKQVVKRTKTSCGGIHTQIGRR